MPLPGAGGFVDPRRISLLAPDTDLLESDARLVTRFQAGDQEAFTILVRRWEGPLLRVAYRITGRMAEAEDVRQRVLLKLLENPGAVRRPELFASWMHRTAVNDALSALRQKKRRERRIERLARRVVPSNVSSPGDSLIAEEQAHRLNDALSRLEPQIRAMLSLRFDENLTFAEIAAVLGRPASTIKSRFGRAVDRLRELMTITTHEQDEASP